MIKIFLLFLLPLSLFGSKILSYNIYDRTDRVDVMITFDTPYTGIIKKRTTDSKIIIKLQNTSIESTKLKQVASKYLNTLSITPMSNYVKIEALVPSNVVLKASKTTDSYGLRLRFQNISSTANKQNTQIQQQDKTSLSALPTKKDEIANEQYYIVLTILIVGIIVLFVVKRKVTPARYLKDKTPTTNKNSWLFNQKNAPPQTTDEQNNNSVSIRFQKEIDKTNSVVMLDFMEQSYLVMMGNTNVLLDRFHDNKPTTQEDFESILQERHQVLEEFLSQKDQEKPAKEEPIQSYSKKASSISYET